MTRLRLLPKVAWHLKIASASGRPGFQLRQSFSPIISRRTFAMSPSRRLRDDQSQNSACEGVVAVCGQAGSLSYLNAATGFLV